MTKLSRFYYRVICLFFLMVINPYLNSQDIDSMERSLSEDSIPDIKKIEILNQVSLNLTMTDSRRALETINEALNLATAINYEKGLANAYRNLSIVYFYYDANYSISMEYLQSAYDLFQKLDDSVGIANCYISLGHAYRNIHNIKQELEYHQKSFDVFSRLKMTERIGVTALNLGESYLNNNDFTNGRRFLDYSIRINDSIRKLTTLSTCYKAMGMLELKEKNYAEAEKQFLKVLKIADSLVINSQKIATIESMINLAKTYKLTGKSELHLVYLKKAAEFSQKYFLISYLQNIYTELILYYSSSDNQSEVQKYIAEYRNVSDSVVARQNIDRLNQINSIIQVHELEKSMRKLEEISLVQKERLRIRTLIIIAGLISVSILIWLLISISGKNKKITEVNRILQKQREIIENQSLHLEELNNTKDKFFSIVAHDLMSPMVSLKQFSDLLIDQVDSLSVDEIKSMGNNLQSALDNAIRMTDNLLTWARLQMKDYEIRPERINVSAMISEIIELYGGIAGKKGINLESSVDPSIAITGDKNQLAFIFRNLINNAIKFTEKGGFVKILTQLLPGGKTEISVTDSGTGIPENQKNELFFIGRKHSAAGTAGEKGTGLGLILSFEFVKMNNGNIEVESMTGKGTTFRVILKSG